MPPRPLPDPRSSIRALIAHTLRVLREKEGMTGADLGAALGVERAKVSKLEYGDQPLSESQALAADHCFGTGHLLQTLVYLARTAHVPGPLGEHFEQEARAETIRIYHPTLIPGLLQVEAYARACLVSAGAADVDGALRRRLSRQAVLDRKPAPVVRALVDEGALDRLAAVPPDARRDQLEHLAALAGRPGISIRVVPRSEMYPGLDGPFKVLTLPPGLDVGYVEGFDGGRVVVDPPEVRSLRDGHDAISDLALSVRSSRALLGRLVKEIEE